MLKMTCYNLIAFMAVAVALPGMLFFSLSEVLEEKALKLKGKQKLLEE